MDNEYYIKRCISLAKKSRLQNEIPVGAVLVYRNEVISEGHNLSISKNDPTAHAEINVLRDACKKKNNYRLNNSVLYVSLEPCIMCTGASFWTQLNKIVYGAKEPKRGTSDLDIKLFHPKTKITFGILEKECSDLMKKFFNSKR